MTALFVKRHTEISLGVNTYLLADSLKDGRQMIIERPFQRFWQGDHHDYYFSKNIENFNYNNLRTLDKVINRHFEAEWLEDLQRKCEKNGKGPNKRGTNRLFKSTFQLEKYLQMNMSTWNCSALACFRCGIGPSHNKTKIILDQNCSK